MLIRSILNKDLIYTALGNIGNNILGGLFWFVLASIASVEEYGYINYAIAISVVPASIGILGLNITISTYLAKGFKEIAYEGSSLIFITSIIAGILLTLFYDVTLAIVSASIMYFTISVSILVGSKKFGEYALISIVQRLIQIFTSIYLYNKFGISGAILGYALGPLIMSYKFFVSLKHFTFKITKIKEKIVFTFHSYGLSLTQSLSAYLDKVLIGYLFGFAVLGLYQLAFQFLMLIMIIPSILFTYLLPHEASGIIPKEVKYLGVLASVFIFFAFYTLAPMVISFLFPRYVVAIPIIQIMSFAVIPSSIAMIANAKLLGHEKSKFALKGGIIYLIIILLLIPIFGLIGGITGMAFAVIVTHVVRAIYLVKIAGI